MALIDDKEKIAMGIKPGGFVDALIFSSLALGWGCLVGMALTWMFG